MDETRGDCRLFSSLLNFYLFRTSRFPSLLLHADNRMSTTSRRFQWNYTDVGFSGWPPCSMVLSRRSPFASINRRPRSANELIIRSLRVECSAMFVPVLVGPFVPPIKPPQPRGTSYSRYFLEREGFY